MTIAKKECEYPQLGQNIRALRELSEISVTHMLQQLSNLGLATSRARYGYWERGENTIPHTYVAAISKILDIRIELLYYWHLRDTPFYTDRIKRLTSMSDTIAEMDTPEQEILSYIFHEWEGSLKALVQWVGMYVSITSKTLREGWAGAGLMVYEDAVNRGLIDPKAPKADVAFVEKVCMQMSKNK